MHNVLPRLRPGGSGGRRFTQPGSSRNISEIAKQITQTKLKGKAKGESSRAAGASVRT